MTYLMANESLADALAGKDEVQITFVKSKDGKRYTIPVWFVLDGTRLQLLPMHGLKTHWFRDVVKGGGMKVGTKNVMKRVAPNVVRNPGKVEEVKKLFSQKYGEADVRKYYSTSEVALEIPL